MLIQVYILVKEIYITTHELHTHIHTLYNRHQQHKHTEHFLSPKKVI